MNLANRISFFRIILIPIFVFLILEYTPQKEFFRFLAASLFILSVLTDWLDGYIARKKHEVSKLGVLLDPIADKLLINTAFILLFLNKELSAPFILPVWIPLVVLSRDILLILGSLAIHLAQGKIDIHPRILGKISTFFQTLSIAFIILRIQFTPVACYIAGFFTVASGLDYAWRSSRLIGSH